MLLLSSLSLCGLRVQIIAGTEAPAASAVFGENSAVGENGGGYYAYGSKDAMRRSSVTGNSLDMDALTLSAIQNVRAFSHAHANVT